MSSLFGAKPASNLFAPASSSTSQPAQTSSLFGNTQPQQASNFQPQQQTSLFPIVGSSQPTLLGGSTLFGSTTVSQPPQQSSVFENLAGQQKTTSASTTGGLFGTSPLASSQAPSTSNPFGIPATSQPAPTSIFAPQQQQHQNQPSQVGLGQTQQSNEQQHSVANKTSQPAYFDNLLEKGRKRSRDADGEPGFQTLPSLQLGLQDIAKKVREIGGLGSPLPRGKGADSNA